MLGGRRSRRSGWCRALDPAGVGARDLRECLLIQIESRNGRGGVAWQIIANHLKLLENRQYRRNSPRRWAGRMEHIQIAVNVIQHAGSACPGCATPGRARAWWSRTFTSPRMATSTSSS